ncbi:fimbrial protein [Atlantibacter hermannii]|nr:fimbrial protein [Atlantibacter hermannii]NBD00090.1 fimbrial protein [Atlantibacter hermannii]
MNNLKLRPFFIFLILIINGFISCSVWADCTFKNGTSTDVQKITPPSLRIAANTPADTVIWDSGIITGSSVADIYCYTETVVTSGYQTAKTLITGISSPNVYQTNNPGIGIRMLASANAQNLLTMTWPRGTEQAHATYGYKQQMYFKVQLIATGKPITSGTLDLSSFVVDRVFGTARQFLLSFSNSSITVQSVGCDLDTRDISVALTDGRGVVITSLNTPGATTSPVNFGINLSCQLNANVSITFQGTTISGKQDTLALDNQAQSTSAQGVGVQILQHGEPIMFGMERAILNNVTSTKITLPFQARLIRLNDNIRAGDINATATFDMIYR